jgi:hypothetical protein
MIIITATQFYQDRKREQFGEVTKSAHSTTYENLELIVGFDDKNKVSLFGRGAHSSGYYSVTFDDPESLQKFIDAKKDDFSTRQLEWLSWSITNPR